MPNPGFRKVLRDCPNGNVRLSDVLREMRRRVNGNPQCIRFFQQHFGIHPDRLFDPNSEPTIAVDPQLPVSGRTRCPSPSVRIQPAICQSPLRERVIMHELTHYAGCMTRTHTPCSEALAQQGANICMGTVREALEAARRRGRRTPTP
jgi:hypothetical protein